MSREKLLKRLVGRWISKTNNQVLNLVAVWSKTDGERIDHLEISDNPDKVVIFSNNNGKPRVSLKEYGKLDLHIDGKKSSKNVIVWTSDNYESKEIWHNKPDANVQVYTDSSANLFSDFGGVADSCSHSFQPPTDSVVYAVDLLGCIHMSLKPSENKTSISCSLPVGFCITTDTFLMQNDDQHTSEDSPRTPPVPSPPELHPVPQPPDKYPPWWYI